MFLQNYSRWLRGEFEKGARVSKQKLQESYRVQAVDLFSHGIRFCLTSFPGQSDRDCSHAAPFISSCRFARKLVPAVRKGRHYHLTPPQPQVTRSYFPSFSLVIKREKLKVRMFSTVKDSKVEKKTCLFIC